VQLIVVNAQQVTIALLNQPTFLFALLVIIVRKDQFMQLLVQLELLEHHKA